MEYLTADQVLFIHYRLISETGGRHGVVDPLGLASALHQAEIGQEEIPFPHSLFRTTAILFYSLIKSSFFIDGNPATAVAVTAFMLRINGFRLTVDQQKLQELVTQVQQEKLEISWLETWLADHITAL